MLKRKTDPPNISTEERNMLINLVTLGIPTTESAIRLGNCTFRAVKTAEAIIEKRETTAKVIGQNRFRGLDQSYCRHMNYFL